MKKTIRIATRKSPLALWQAEYVKKALLTIDPDLETIFIGLTTLGDKEPTKSLTDIGGKLLFVKELQNALLNNEADIAVHSIKDLSVEDFPGLKLAAICEREDPRDAFISMKYPSLDQLPKGAIVGTASPRRRALLKNYRPDLQIKVLRGNIGTRLNQCEQGNYHAILLAVAGLKRLKFENYITDYLDPEKFIPAIGQGAIGIECRENDAELCELLQAIHHTKTTLCVAAERAVNHVLGGDCHTPIAAYATINHQQLRIRSMVGSVDGKIMIRNELFGPPENGIELGKTLGKQLLGKGADQLLRPEY